MEKTLPAPLVQVYKTWSHKDIRELIGEMMDMAKQRGNQIKGEFCLSGSQLEKAVDRFILSLMHFSVYTATDPKVRLVSFFIVRKNLRDFHCTDIFRIRLKEC